MLVIASSGVAVHIAVESIQACKSDALLLQLRVLLNQVLSWLLCSLVAVTSFPYNCMEIPQGKGEVGRQESHLEFPIDLSQRRQRRLQVGSSVSYRLLFKL